MGISLVAGWFPPALVAVAVIVLLAAVGWRTARWRRTVAGLAAASVGLSAAVWAYVTSNDLVVPSLPLVAYSWVGVVIFAVLVSVAGWSSGTRRHRSLAAVSIVSSTLMAACLFNAYFAYFPTVRSLVGSPTAHQVSAAQIERARAQPRTAVATLSLRPGQPVHGVTFEVPIPGVVSGFRARSAWVYLPPAWFDTPRPRLPVIMLLEGTPSEPVDWFRGGLADRTADRFAARHGGMAPILVLPDENGSFQGDTECTDLPKARAETYLTTDVRRFVIRHYAAPTNPSAWAVAGLSEGGTCAFDLALRHSNQFRLFGDFAGDAAPQLRTPQQTLQVLFGGSKARQAAFDPAALLRGRPRTRRMFGFFECGSGDHLRSLIGHHLAHLAARSGIRTQWRTMPGPHNFVVWGASFHSALDYFWPRFRVDGGPTFDSAVVRIRHPVTTPDH